MAADAFPADMAVPMPAPAPVLPIVVAAAQVERAARRLYIRISDVQKYGNSMNCPGCGSVMMGTTARAHTEERRSRLEESLAGDEETKFRSEAAKLRVEGWWASRVESAEKSTRGGETESHVPSGAASSPAPVAAASSSATAVAASSSAAGHQHQGDEVPHHGVKKVRWSPQVQDASESDLSETNVRPRGIETTTRVHDGGSGRRRSR